MNTVKQYFFHFSVHLNVDYCFEMHLTGEITILTAIKMTIHVKVEGQGYVHMKRE